MKDMIPKGTGNSRYLRSVSNFKAIYPTYDDFVNALVAGNLPVDFNGINEAGIQQVGTSLNKANLLTDEVARQVGLRTADPTPNDMFNVLANIGNVHVWKRVQTYADPVPEVPAGYTLGEVNNNVPIVTLNDGYNYLTEIYITVAAALSVTQDGNISLSNATTNRYNLVAWTERDDTLALLAGNFVMIEESSEYNTPYLNTILFVPADATITGDKDRTITLTKVQSVTGYPYTPAIPAGTTTDYLTSTDRNAYTDGTVGNTTITYLGQLGGGARIEVGSYVGTGTYGSSNPNSLTFGFEPKIIWIAPVSGTYISATIRHDTNEGVAIYEATNIYSLTTSWSGNTVTWYNRSSNRYQLNESGVAYSYIALG